MLQPQNDQNQQYYNILRKFSVWAAGDIKIIFVGNRLGDMSTNPGSGFFFFFFFFFAFHIELMPLNNVRIERFFARKVGLIHIKIFYHVCEYVTVNLL